MLSGKFLRFLSLTPRPFGPRRGCKIKHISNDFAWFFTSDPLLSKIHFLYLSTGIKTSFIWQDDKGDSVVVPPLLIKIKIKIDIRIKIQIKIKIKTNIKIKI